jgi:type VI secretion system protein VasD
MRQPFRTGAMCLFATLATSLAGCGIGQAVKDSTVDAAKWAFTTQVKTMNLDLASRSSLNATDAGKSLSTVVRVYQLKRPDAFRELSYAQLQTNDLAALKPDLLAQRDVVLRPDERVSLAEPMHADAEFVGIVALFRNPDEAAGWKLVVPRRQWKQTDPVRVEVRANTLALTAPAKG